jgi:hypothetical protein
MTGPQPVAPLTVDGQPYDPAVAARLHAAGSSVDETRRIVLSA